MAGLRELIRELGKNGVAFDYHNTMPFNVSGGLKSGIFEIEEPGTLGDVNGDGKVTIADVTALVNIILGK